MIAVTKINNAWSITGVCVYFDKVTVELHMAAFDMF